LINCSLKTNIDSTISESAERDLCLLKVLERQLIFFDWNTGSLFLEDANEVPSSAAYDLMVRDFRRSFSEDMGHGKNRVDLFWASLPFEKSSQMLSEVGELLTFPSYSSLQKNAHLSRLNFLLDDDEIVALRALTGLNHRGIEAAVKQQAQLDSAALFKQLSPQSLLTLFSAWCLMGEKQGRFVLSRRFQALLMVFMEVERITTHLRLMGNFLAELYDSLVARKAFSLEQELRKIVFHFWDDDFYAMKKKVDAGIAREREYLLQILDIGHKCQKFVQEIELTILRDRFFAQSLNAGQIDRLLSKNWGAQGPLVRAAGLNWDWRKRTPYLLYDELDFEVVVGQEGKIFDRLAVRLKEIEQSVNILKQLIENLPFSDLLNLDVAKNVSPTGDFIVVLEGPNGAIGFLTKYLSGSLQSFSFITPAPIHLFLGLCSLRGARLSQVPNVLMSLGLEDEELSR